MEQSEIIKLPCYTKNSIITARSCEETMALSAVGTFTSYGVFADLISANYEISDRICKYLGECVATGVVKAKYDKQYFNPKYGKFKNFLTRNIYINPEKREALEKEREMYANVAIFTTEELLKILSRVCVWLLNKKERLAVYSQMYGLLRNYTLHDASGNNEAAENELSKIFYQFNLEKSEQKALKKEFKNKNTVPLHELDLSFAHSDKGFPLLESLSYCLFTIGTQKYGDLDAPENKMHKDTLLQYYNQLGFENKVGIELFESNRESYEDIAFDQKIALSFAQNIVRKAMIQLPDMPNIEQINAKAVEIAKYDPYSITRKKVKAVGKGVAGVLGGAAESVAGFISLNPILALNGISTALSQFKMTENATEAMHDKLIKYGLNEKGIKEIFDHTEKIQQESLEIGS